MEGKSIFIQREIWNRQILVCSIYGTSVPSKSLHFSITVCSQVGRTALEVGIPISKKHCKNIEAQNIMSKYYLFTENMLILHSSGLCEVYHNGLQKT